MNEDTKFIIRQALRNSTIEIQFIKKDETVRTMNATLNPDIAEYPDTPSVRKENESIQPVWDVDLGAWRSFDWNTLISFDGIGIE